MYTKIQKVLFFLQKMHTRNLHYETHKQRKKMPKKHKKIQKFTQKMQKTHKKCQK